MLTYTIFHSQPTFPLDAFPLSSALFSIVAILVYALLLFGPTFLK